jgi:cyclohexadieny/prephenate dehydrogenase
VGAYRDVAIKMAPYIKSGTIITDVGSVKMAAIDALQDFIPDHAYLLPGHPIAGTENSGPEAGFAELFQDRWWLLTPLENTPQDSVEKLKTLYTGFGSKIGIMPPEHHDRVLAMTSHLPHLIAYSIVDTCVKLEASMQQEVIAFSASGFRDFTRIAASDPTMWRDIFLNNRDAVLDGLQNFIDDLTILQTAIKQGDGDTLFDVFTRTRAVRRSIIDQRQHVPEEAKKN